MNTLIIIATFFGAIIGIAIILAITLFLFIVISGLLIKMLDFLLE